MKKFAVRIATILMAAALVFALSPALALAAAGDVHIEGDYTGLEQADGTVKIVVYSGPVTGDVTVPGTVAGYAVSSMDPVFAGKTGLTGITLPEGLKSLAASAFAGDTALASVSLPSTLQTIGQAAFSGCTALQQIDLPLALQGILEDTFLSCSNLQTVTMHNNVLIIKEEAFKNCSKLSSISLSTGLTAVRSYAFNGCSSLHTVNIPASLTAIGNDAFMGCGLTSIDIPATVHSIGMTAFSPCTSLTSVTFHEGLQTIGAGCFYQDPLTQVTIPASVTTVSGGAFSNCASLTKVTILGNSVTLSGGPFNGSSLGDGTKATANGIYGFSGSTAQTYATLMHFNFYTLHTVSFDCGSGSAVADDYVVDGQKVTKPTDPTLDGMFFAGWYKDTGYSQPWNFDTDTVTANTQLHALWVTLLKLTVSPADGKIYTGGRVTITPNVEGDWEFDSSYLSRSGNEFTGLKAGNTTVRYSAGAQSQSVNVTITQGQLPQTGQDFTPVVLLLAGAALSCAAVAFVWIRRKAYGQGK